MIARSDCGSRKSPSENPPPAIAFQIRRTKRSQHDAAQTTESGPFAKLRLVHKSGNGLRILARVFLLRRHLSIMSFQDRSLQNGCRLLSPKSVLGIVLSIGVPLTDMVSSGAQSSQTTKVVRSFAGD